MEKLNWAKGWLWALMLSLGSFNAAADVDINKTYNDLYQYLQYWRDDSATLNVERVKRDLSIIEAFFDSATSVLPRGVEYRRTVRALAYHQINSYEFEKNKRFNVDEVEQAAADMHYVIENGENQYWVEVFGYYLARLYTNWIKDDAKAAKAWLSCAKTGQGGCINILGNAYFLGKYGLSVNFEQAVYWHKKTVDTGTDFTCAGIFSAFFLANVSHKFPSVNTGKTWFEWVEVAQTLSEKLNELNEDRTLKFTCALQSLYIAALGMAESTKMISEQQTSTFAEQALLYAENQHKNRIVQSAASDNDILPMSPEVLIAQAVVQNDWERVFEQMEQIEHAYDKCFYALSLSDLARAQKNRSVLSRLDDYLVANEVQHCETPMQFRSLMQENGTWNIQ